MFVKLESVTMIPLNKSRRSVKIHTKLNGKCADRGKNSWYEEIADLDLTLDFRGKLLNSNSEEQCVMLNTSYKRSHSFNKGALLKIDHIRGERTKIIVNFEDELSVDDSQCEAELDFDGIIGTRAMGHILVKSAIEKVYQKEEWVGSREQVPSRRMLRGFLLFKLRICK